MKKKNSKCIILTKDEQKEIIYKITHKTEDMINISRKTLIIGTTIVGISLYSGTAWTKEPSPLNPVNSIIHSDKGIADIISQEKEWVKKGDLLYSECKYDEAIKCYDKAIWINPKSIQALYGKGLCLYGQSKYDEALLCYNGVLTIDPQYTYAWYGKALVLYKQCKYEETIKCCDMALAINPKYTGAQDCRNLALQAINASPQSNSSGCTSACTTCTGNCTGGCTASCTSGCTSCTSGCTSGCTYCVSGCTTCTYCIGGCTYCTGCIDCIGCLYGCLYSTF